MERGGRDNFWPWGSGRADMQSSCQVCACWIYHFSRGTSLTPAYSISRIRQMHSVFPGHHSLLGSLHINSLHSQSPFDLILLLCWWYRWGCWDTGWVSKALGSTQLAESETWPRLLGSMFKKNKNGDTQPSLKWSRKWIFLNLVRNVTSS